ncbi:MAG: hypothetical protein NTX66_02785 [Candidatus Falkowbacteria bacterium]|nr:hypothetical protein [Candidatus Falkowbacteria bacterium]
MFFSESKPSKKSDMIEQFVILGKGLVMNATAAFSSSSAKKKSPNKTKGTIILCSVKSGKVVPGEQIEIKLPGGVTLHDEIVRIELDKEAIPFGAVGQDIGICLAKTNIKTIQSYFAERAGEAQN